MNKLNKRGDTRAVNLVLAIIMLTVAFVALYAFLGTLAGKQSLVVEGSVVRFEIDSQVAESVARNGVQVYGAMGDLERMFKESSGKYRFEGVVCREESKRQVVCSALVYQGKERVTAWYERWIFVPNNGGREKILFRVI